jgi:integrase
MAVHKRKYRGKIVWRYKFDAPGSTREHRIFCAKVGFATKQAAIDAEAARRIEEQKKYEMRNAGAAVTAEVPKTLAMLLDEFMRQHAQEKLSPTTVEGYQIMASHLAPELLAMPLTEITPLHLNREWTRLVKSGGHKRKTKEARPLAAKTVRNIAGLVSSAFSRAIRWGLVEKNPATNSEPPRAKKHIVGSLIPAEQTLVLKGASGPWCMEMLLKMAEDTGARRGEILALRWSDIRDGIATIERALIQTKARGLEFKSTKTERPRRVDLPASTVACLEDHRKRQDIYRQQYGADYRADLDLIFANPDGTPLKPGSVSATVSALMKRLKLPKSKGASLHLLRHSHASILLANGVDLATVSQRLGHSSIRTTAEIYAHALRGKDRAAADKWDQVMQGGGDTTENTKTVN